MSALLTILLVAIMGVSLANAGAKLKIDDESYIDLGFRVQALYMNEGDTDTDGDGELDRTDEFALRRARFRLKGVINEHVTAFLQTDVAGTDGGVGYDMRVIDAWVNFQYNNWTQLYVGENMAPALRQNLTSSGALMAFDRPGLAYRSLNWGVRSRAGLTRGGSMGGIPGLSTPAAVRDVGATLFGSGALNDNTSMKYYAGMYNGSQAGVDDKERFTGRAQVNFGDAEGGYYNSSTYLGKKNTIGVGVSFDTQSEIAPAGDKQDAEYVDYTLMSADLFVEKPVGNNWLTFEGGWIMVDLDDVESLMDTQGNGFYGQAGLLIQQWQPWVLFETWSSDADETDAGTPGKHTTFRLGVTYFIKGHNANIKAGFESFKSDVAFYEEEDTISTFSLGFFTTY